MALVHVFFSVLLVAAWIWSNAPVVAYRRLRELKEKQKQQ